LLIGVGSALVIVTLLLVFIIPSGRRGRQPNFTRRRLAMPSPTISSSTSSSAAASGSPAGSLIKGVSYLYGPIRYQHVRYSVGGRLELAIARVDAVDPSVAPERVGQALHQMVDLDNGHTEPPVPPANGELDVFDQPRSEEET
jgi:hypothetical protein